MTAPVVARDSEATRLELIAAGLAVAAPLSVYLLPSQSTSALFTYLLAVLVAVSLPRWWGCVRGALPVLVAILLVYLPTTGFWSEQASMRAFFSDYTRSLWIVAWLLAVASALSRFAWFEWALTWGMTALAPLAVIAAIVNFYRVDPWDGRLFGLGQLGGHVVAALCFGVALLFSLHALFNAPRLAWLAVPSILVLGYAVVMSGSRNAWVSVTAGVLVLLGLYLPRHWRRRVLLGSLGVLALVLGVVGLAWSDPDWWAALQAALLPRGDSFRLSVWSTSWQRVVDGGLLFGLGIQTPDDVTVAGYRLQHPHNLYLAMLVQGGLVALLLLLSVLGTATARLWRRLPSSQARLALAILAIAAPAYLLDGFELIDKVGSTWLLIWLPVAFALAPQVEGGPAEVSVARAQSRTSPSGP